MRFKGKFYGADARKASVDSLWADASRYRPMPERVKDHGGAVVSARSFFDCAAVGCGWVIDTRCGIGDASLAREYAQADAAVLMMMARMLSEHTAKGDAQDAARYRARLKCELSANFARFPEDQSEIRKLARQFREAARAFWKYALTRS